MDFEQQLEKAEKLAQPSLVGSSLRLADDSQHNNYIHPEKSAAEKSRDFKKKSLLLNSALGASLDDLINEGALIGDESSFDKYLDNLGHIKDEALASEEPEDESNRESLKEATIGGEKKTTPSLTTSTAQGDVPEGADDVDQKETSFTASDATPAATESGSALYSTPNLSEYQLENQIKDHNDLLSLVQSINPLRLPARHDYPENVKQVNHNRTPSNHATPSLVEPTESQFSALPVKDQIHVPYLQRDGRSSSRSRGPPPRTDRSRSRSSSSKPHLARGDSYKNTVTVSDPKKYERPATFDELAEEGDDRRSRASRPTMGATIAAAERAQALGSLRSLLTSGDYTNFNVDQAGPQLSTDLYSSRSESSYNYLRSISRSRLRQPGDKGLIPHDKRSSLLNEKYDADTTELKSEGALVSDDPYDSINNLSTMVEEVLHHKGEDGEQAKNSEETETPLKESVESEDIETRGKEVEDEETEPLNFKRDVPSAQDDKEIELPTSTITEATETTKPKDIEETETPNLDVDEEVEKVEIPNTDDKTSKVGENSETDMSKDEEEVKENEEVTQSQVSGTAEREADIEEEVTEKAAKLESDPIEIEAKLAETTLEDLEPESEVSKPVDVNSEASEAKFAIQEPSETHASKTPLVVEEVSRSASTAKSVVEDDSDLEEVSPEELRKHLESQPVYIFTSLAGGMQITHRTNKLAMILKANQVEFTARDLGTDEEAKKIWRRYSGGKTLPGVVRGDDYIGNWEQIEEANEEYRVRELIYETL